MLSSVRRTAFILSLGLILPLVSVGQTAKADSLKKVLASLPPEGRSYASDTVRVLVLYQLSIDYLPSDSSVLFSNKIGHLRKKITWPSVYFYYEMSSGHYQFHQGKYYKAIDHYFKALSEAEKNNEPSLEGYAYRFLGDCYYSVKQYPRSVEQFQKAIKLLKPYPSNIQYLVSLNNLGMTYNSLGKYQLAEKVLLSCLYQNNQRKVYAQKVVGYCYENLSDTYLGTKQFDLAEQYLLKAITIRQNLKTNELYGLYPKVAQVFLLKKDLINARKYANLANQYSAQTQGFYRTLTYYVNYQVYKELKETVKALGFYERYTILKDSNEVNNAQKIVDGIRFEYQNEKQKLAINNLRQTLENEKNIKAILLVSILIFSGLLFLLWKSNTKIKKQNKNIENISDQLQKVNSNLEDLNQNLESKVMERTKELLVVNQELIQKNKEIQEAFVNGKTQERKRVASELHDNLGSTISGLIWQLEGSMPENLSPTEQSIYESLVQQMRDAYAEVRHISHHLLPVELEKGFINALQKLVNDLNNNGKIKFIISGEYSESFLQKSQEVELYSICLEAINNSLKHSQATEFIIKIRKDMENLIISLSDNGTGFSLDSDHSKKRGKGLQNIKDRVDTLEGCIEVKSQKNKGTEFIITIPIVSDF